MMSKMANKSEVEKKMEKDAFKEVTKVVRSAWRCPTEDGGWTQVGKGGKVVKVPIVAGGLTGDHFPALEKVEKPGRQVEKKKMVKKVDKVVKMEEKVGKRVVKKVVKKEERVMKKEEKVVKKVEKLVKRVEKDLKGEKKVMGGNVGKKRSKKVEVEKLKEVKGVKELKENVKEGRKCCRTEVEKFGGRYLILNVSGKEDKVVRIEVADKILQVDGAGDEEEDGAGTIKGPQRSKTGKFLKGVPQSKSHKFRCNFEDCDFSYKNASSLRTHKWRAHGVEERDDGDFEGRKRRCPEPECNLSFKSKDKLFDHLQVKHGKGVEEAGTLRDAAKEVHPEFFHQSKRKVQCDLCEERFAMPKRMKRHLMAKLHGLDGLSADRMIDRMVNGEDHFPAEDVEMEDQEQTAAEQAELEEGVRRMEVSETGLPSCEETENIGFQEVCQSSIVGTPDVSPQVSPARSDLEGLCQGSPALSPPLTCRSGSRSPVCPSSPPVSPAEGDLGELSFSQGSPPSASPNVLSPAFTPPLTCRSSSSGSNRSRSSSISSFSSISNRSRSLSKSSSISRLSNRSRSLSKSSNVSRNSNRSSVRSGSRSSSISSRSSSRPSSASAKANHCSICKKSFVQTQSARRHMRNVHKMDKKEIDKQIQPPPCPKDQLDCPGGKGKALCPICRQSFAQMQSARRHMKNVHNMDKSQIDKHMRVVPKSPVPSEMSPVYIPSTDAESGLPAPNCSGQRMRSRSRSSSSSSSGSSSRSSSSSSSSSRSKGADIKKKKNPGKQVSCPICDKTFAQTSNVRVHMKTIHRMETKEVDKQLKGIGSTTSKCPNCMKPQTNLWRHLKTCSGGRNSRLVVSKKGRPVKVDENVTLMGEFKKWSEPNPRELNPVTIKRHIKYSEEILAYFDHEVPSFNSEKLMSKDNPPDLPDIEIFLPQIQSAGMKSHYVAAYMYFNRFLQTSFRTRNWSNKVNYADKNARQSHLKDMADAAGEKWRSLKKSIEKERLNNKKERARNPAVLTFNMPRAEELFRKLWRSEKLAEIVTDIRKATREELWEKHALDETKIRDILASLCIVFGGGNRAVVITNMTVGEFENAVENEDGQRQVDVKEHKTDQLGAAPLPFIFEGLYEACDRYRRDFRPVPGNPDESLFITKNGGPIKPNNCIQSLKRFLDLTEEEREKWNVEVWRKVWATWNSNHPDEVVKNWGFSTLLHDEKTSRKHYVQVQQDVGIRFANEMIRSMAFGENDAAEAGQDKEAGPSRARERGEPPKRRGEPAKRRGSNIAPDGPARKSSRLDVFSKGSKTTFSPDQRKFIREIFGQRQTLSASDIQNMAESNTQFKALLEALIKHKEQEVTTNTAPVMDRVKAAIRKCLIG